MIVPFRRQPDPTPVYAFPAETRRLSLENARLINASPDTMWPAFMVSEAQQVLQAARHAAIAPPAPYIHIEEVTPGPGLRFVPIQTPPLRTAQGRAADQSAQQQRRDAIRKGLHQTATFLAGLALGLFLSTLLVDAARSAAADAAIARDIANLILSGH